MANGATHTTSFSENVGSPLTVVNMDAETGSNMDLDDSVSQVSSRLPKTSAATKRAALAARSKVLKDLQELELREVKCRQERECLELQMKLAEAEAEEFEQLFPRNASVASFSELFTRSALDPDAPEWTSSYVAANTTPVYRPGVIVSPRAHSSPHNEMQFGAVPLVGAADNADNVVDVDGSVADGNGLAHLISQGQHQQQQMLEALQMPQAELSTYDGDPMKYWMFIRAFDNNVGCLSVDDSKKLTRLLYYCRGKALSLIQCCASMDPKIGYAKARSLLEERFGNRYVVTEAWLAKVTEGPILDNWDSDGLQEFADNLRCCKETLEAMGNAQEINGQRVLVKVVERLPAYLQVRWRKSVGDIRRVKGRMPDFCELVKFVENSAEEANDPVYGRLNGKGKSKPSSVHHTRLGASRGTVRSTNFSTDVKVPRKESYNTEVTKCFLCEGSHPLFKCKSFLNKSLEERLKIARDKGLCFNCLSGRHLAARCKSAWLCTVPGCGKRHSKLLHRPAGTENSNNVEDVSSPNVVVDAEASALCGSIGAGNLRIALPIVPVQVRALGRCIRTCALLDTGSTNTFCSAALLERLEISGKRQTLSLTTLDKADTTIETERVSLQVLDMDENNVLDLPCVFTRAQLPVHIRNRAQPQDIGQWPHLEGIDLPQVSIGEVDLLIGQDVPAALTPIEVRTGAPGTPYAVKTLLGWTLNGPLGLAAEQQKASVNFVHADACLEQQVRQFWELEGGHLISDEKAMSVNDKKAVECWDESLKLADGHYELAIPFKVRPVVLPNNRSVAERRLNLLKRKLVADRKKYESYQRSIEEMIDKGYAVKVPDDELQRSDGAVWYLPHHGVTSEHKPDKLRVVFDCAARFKNVSLNEHILQGPDLTNKLVGVLMRFRQDSIALMADIESMFHQVHVTPRDRDVLRFLWWPGGDFGQEPEEYRMTVHLFGGVWSPSCANYALRRTAEDNRAEFSKEVVGCVQRDFYVDDFLKSVGSPQVAIRLISELSELLRLGGFHLTKWICNDRTVMKTVIESERAKVIKGLDLTCEKLPTERALGLVWDVETDTFGFSTVVKDKPPTRRGILSIVSSVYDPLGFLSPSILPAKVIIQELCRRNIGWDDTIPTDLLSRWSSWQAQLRKVEELKVKRCVEPPKVDDTEFTLHHFCDASEVSYGAATYLRSSDSKGNYSCSLLMAKSRLAPIKTITIPRLELSAAALAVKMDRLIRAELDIKLCSSWFWTDSSIVLSYIQNIDKRFQTFVANRIAIICEGSSPSQWRHVRTELNPADDVSRGLSFEQLIRSQRWFHGPSFLVEDDSTWPDLPELNVDSAQLETKAGANCCAAINCDTSESVIDRLCQRYSSFYKLKKSVAWLLRVKTFLMNRAHKKQVESLSGLSPLTVEEIQQAERAVIRYVQLQAYDKEFKLMKSSECEVRKENRHSDLRRLEPFLSADGVLCVGGRLRKAPISEEAKHPMIVPKDSLIAKLIVRHYHAAANHSGQEHTLALLRERFWIVNARVIVRAELKDCYQCRRRASQVCSQKMADLPADRVTPNKPPFTYVGIDYFGPFMIKQGRSLVKRYGCLFTCLTTRAVHLEVASSMDTDTFINVLRRFICRRGPAEIIRSDNATNFVGAERELSRAVNSLNQVKIAECLRQKEITWLFNPPAASHMGGVWERMIRSVRRILTLLMKEQTLTDETLLTLMCEVESTINSRPITVVSDDPNDMEPLTPNHLLMMRGPPTPVMDEVDRRDAYRRRWKQVQYMAALFWRRWTREYLPALQQRNKWINPKPNLKVNDIVIVADETTLRNVWPIGRILAVFPGDDGLVRSVRVKTATSVLTRPVSKVCLLETVD